MKRITAILLCVLLCISLAACSRNSEDIGSSLSLVSTYENDQAETTGNSETDETTTGNTTVTESSAPDTSGSDDSTVNDTTGDPTDTSEPDTTEGSQTGTPNTPDIRPSGGTTGTGSNKTETSKDADTSEDTKPSQTTTPPADTSTESKPTDETKPTETTKPSETEEPKNATPPTEETKPEETTPPTETTKPDETEPPAETKPQETTDPYVYPFNIDQIRKDCIDLGKGYGFTLDESLTPNNSSWAGAETASSNTQGTRLKRLLTEMVEYYSPAYREDMGLPAANITAFNIYCESTGNGTYRIYFLFLL